MGFYALWDFMTQRRLSSNSTGGRHCCGVCCILAALTTMITILMTGVQVISQMECGFSAFQLGSKIMEAAEMCEMNKHHLQRHVMTCSYVFTQANLPNKC